VLKILLGRYDRVAETMLNLDLWANAIGQLKVRRAYEQGDCPCCKRRNFEYLDGKRGSGAAALCGRDAVQLTHKQTSGALLDFEELAARLAPHGKVRTNEYLVRAEIVDNGKPYMLSLFADGRAIVHGTGEASVARSIYAKYVGS
jgi:hypothetical protein